MWNTKKLYTDTNNNQLYKYIRDCWRKWCTQQATFFPDLMSYQEQEWARGPQQAAGSRDSMLHKYQTVVQRHYRDFNNY